MCVTGQEQHLTQLEEGEGFLQDHPGVSERTAGEGAPQYPDRGWGECALRLMDWGVELTARGRGAEGQGPGSLCIQTLPLTCLQPWDPRRLPGIQQ